MYICPIVDLYYNKMESKTPSREKEIYKVTVVGSVVNFLLLVFKFFAGIAGHSAAMLADAVHSLSDFVTDIIVIIFVRISNKPEDKDHDYGHGKYETLATAIIGILLLCVGFGILWNGASSIYDFSWRTAWGAGNAGIDSGVGFDCTKGNIVSIYRYKRTKTEFTGGDS